MTMSEPILIVGLGNPGREYRENRHNVGFMLIDRLAVKLNARFSRMQSKALVASVTYDEQKIILAKPQTFMNLSGHSVQGLVHFYKISIINLLIAHDDLDLPVGVIRIRPDGSSAGQKGMESIIQRLGTDEFARIRLGIGRPPGQMQAPDYVLQDFADDDMELISEALNRGVDAVLTFMREGLDSAMNRYNGSAFQP
jgi:PTH1 family peptidyl-tRNA hydrolase